MGNSNSRIASLIPCLPALPELKEQIVSPNKSGKRYLIPPIKNGSDKVILKPSIVSSSPELKSTKDNQKEQRICAPPQAPIKYRPLKLVYDHDIRLAQMPVNSSFKVLRDVVGKCFPMSKAILIKYKDSDGDLVTITCSAQLRLAEYSVDNNNVISEEPENDEKQDSALCLLRLHIVKVNPEYEPSLIEEEEDEEEENEEVKPIEVDKENTKEPDWLVEFAQIFQTHVGIDVDYHMDLYVVGKEFCCEARKKTVTKEEAQTLFDKAASKFQEVAALALFNGGNVHMCAARKRMSIVEAGPKETMYEELENAYAWVTEKYSLANKKYEAALLFKPDFYEGLLALGQQQVEMAKLHWSFVFAKTSDLALKNSAEIKLKVANEPGTMDEDWKVTPEEEEEETVTWEEAQTLFDKASSTFQDVAVLALFSWGNVHMFAARKKMAIDEAGMDAQLYDRVREKYTLAKKKYEEALLINPEFYLGLLALGRQQVEMAKLHWSYAAKKSDFATWNSAETITLLDSAKNNMKAAAEMWQKMENEGKKSMGAGAMRSRFFSYWSKMLYTRSQIENSLLEFKLKKS